MRRWTVTWLLAFVLVGCGFRSQLEPEASLASLDSGARAQLCRFTQDVLESAEPGCADRVPLDPSTCPTDPPWEACPAEGRTADVASWEECVNAVAECSADETRCWHVFCL